MTRRNHVFWSAALMLACTPARPAWAQVTRIEIISREPADGGRSVGQAGPYEILRGRIHGEVDPADRHNTIIQDLELAPRNAGGKIEYVATFALAKPIDLSRSSHVLVYRVVNRGNGTVTTSEDGDISLVSGWQGDVVPTADNQTIVVPVAKNRDGSSITGPMIARFFNVPAGTNTVPIRLSSMGSGPPAYPPASLDQREATLKAVASESSAGVQTGAVTIARDAFAFADCRTRPFPGTPDPTRLCLKDGFDPAKLYELAYTAKDPLVLGIGLAATRDIMSFFRHAKQDGAGTRNPVAGAITHAIAIGDSQSGNFIRTFVHLGFNQDLGGRKTWEGVFPRIAARQTPMNLRFALPGGAAGMYEPGSDGVVWWGPYADAARGRPVASLLDRCRANDTCPKVIEAIGSTEFWGLRMSPDMIGTDAKQDIPLPDNVRRYYYPGTTHGGGRGGFRIDADSAPAGCVLPQNPNPESDTTRALTKALIAWVVHDTPPPASRYPRIAAKELVPPTKTALAFPDIPGVTFEESPINPVLDYEFGPDFNGPDVSGAIALEPPRIRRALPTYVPTVDRDGNETSGVGSVLYQAPLGTYLGWNFTAAGFFAGHGCGFTGGYVPFPKTAADRARTHDPRLSVEERYGTLEGYVCTVQRAAARAVKDRFLLQDDADRLIRDAQASAVLSGNADSSPQNREIGDRMCRSPLP